MLDGALTSDVARVLDANLNRAREGLRVMEEYARFVLGDASLSAACKGLRHSLAAAVGEERIHALQRCRDVAGDVGTAVSAGGEYQRRDAAHVARASAKRVTEALRAIEEYLKVCDAAAGAAVERLRYVCYEVEQRLGSVAEAVRRFADVRVYVILTEAICAGGWIETAGEVLKAGAEALQLREKTVPDRVMLERAKRLAGLCREHGAMFVVNDRPDIAALSGAHGVHVGAEDLRVADVRRIVGPDAIIGVSTHNVEQFGSSLEEMPDYVAVGPMFASATKPRESVAGPETLAAVRGMTALPRVAIGGIHAQNADEVLAADPHAALCACRAVIGAADPGEVVRRLTKRVDAARNEARTRGHDPAAREHLIDPRRSA
ncbi:MAG: thiamine phosphate synthase [Phycisphaerales bacterium]|nr:thiamine phosphate synthase [Phycisphaerales bacterium]